MFKKILLESKVFIVTLIALTAIGITVAGIAVKQDFFKILPLYVSLFVMFLQSKAMRIGPLVGGLNCLLYTAVYFSYGLYATALSTLLMSFPMQIATFIMWSRKKSGSSTQFKTLTRMQLFVIIGIMVIAYIPLLISNKAAGGSYIELDTACAVIGFSASILMLLAYSNYIHFQTLGCFLSTPLYILMIPESPELICYMIYNFYATICCVRAALNISILKANQASGEAQNAECDATVSIQDTSSIEPQAQNEV